MPDHKCFKLQQLVNFQKFSTLRVNVPWSYCVLYSLCSLAAIYNAKVAGIAHILTFVRQQDREQDAYEIELYIGKKCACHWEGYGVEFLV